MGTFSLKTAQGASLLRVDHYAVPRLFFVGANSPAMRDALRHAARILTTTAMPQPNARFQARLEAEALA